jgi:hypothetical protein
MPVSSQLERAIEQFLEVLSKVRQVEANPFKLFLKAPDGNGASKAQLCDSVECRADMAVLFSFINALLEPVAMQIRFAMNGSYR